MVLRSGDLRTGDNLTELLKSIRYLSFYHQTMVKEGVRVTKLYIPSPILMHRLSFLAPVSLTGNKLTPQDV